MLFSSTSVELAKIEGRCPEWVIELCNEFELEETPEAAEKWLIVYADGQ